MDIETRETAVERPCPLCGGRLYQKQGRAITAEGIPAPWDATGHRCENNCLLTAGDLA